MNNELNFRSAFKETLPTVLGYIGIATTVGIIGKTSGLNYGSRFNLHNYLCGLGSTNCY